MRRALVAGNTHLPRWTIVDPLLRKADIVVAADGGADRFLAYGVVPDHVVGDLDSVTDEARKTVGRSRVHWDRDPDSTDLEKVFRFLHRRGVKQVDLVGFGHGRLDHVLGSLAVLSQWSHQFRLTLHDNDFEVMPVRRSVAFRAPKGTLVSLFSPTGAEGVTTRGLRWPLRDATLVPGTLGIHNEVSAPRSGVSFRSGNLLLFRGRRVERHR